MKGIILAEKTYVEVEQLVDEESIVVLPIGGGSKEHGPHLPCGTDFYIVEALAKDLVDHHDIVLLPTLAYGYYPAFVDWPGSVSISGQVFINMVGEIVQSFAKFGVKKFILLDIGVSTQAPLKVLASDLHNELDVYVALTDFSEIWGLVKDEVCQQDQGGHADEGETSLMLAIRPDLVHMDLAIEEYREPFQGTVVNGRRIVSIRSKMSSPNGIHGNATYATAEKGKILQQRSLEMVGAFIEEFRKMK
jgi:creatinine amidohydrolase